MAKQRKSPTVPYADHKNKRFRRGLPAAKEATQIMKKVLDRRMALELKAKGSSYPQIAAHLGVSLETAYRLVQTAASELDEESRELAIRYRDIELETLDSALRQVFPILMGAGKGVEPQHRVAAANAVVRISERRAKLLGLDAPTKVAPVTADGRPLAAVTDVELDAKIAGLLAASATIANTPETIDAEFEEEKP